MNDNLRECVPLMLSLGSPCSSIAIYLQLETVTIFIVFDDFRALKT